jgi:hypothetical protein
MVDLHRDIWIRETGTGQQVAQLHDRYDDDDDEKDRQCLHNVTSSHDHITTIPVETQQYILYVFLSYVSCSVTCKYSLMQKKCYY